MASAPDFLALAEQSVRDQVVALMSESRHEEALALLYRARSADPESRELRQSIDHLKAFLVGVYATRLGGLDRIAPPLPSGASRSADILLVARYIDGNSSFGDISELCPLGQLRTLQLLATLYGSHAGGSRRASSVSGTAVSARLPPSSDAVASSSLNAREEVAPDTARSPSSERRRGLGVTVFADPKSEEAERYKEAFARGTKAFVQERYQDAVEAFGYCAELRADDHAAGVMLRRSLQGLKNQVL